MAHSTRDFVKTLISFTRLSLLTSALVVGSAACSPVHFENLASEQVLKVDVCNEGTEGEAWWEETSERQYECLTCADGTKLNCAQKIETEYDCADFKVRATGRTREGRNVGQIGSCPLPPANACGQNPHGSTWWAETGSHEADCGTCSDGSLRRCVMATESEIRCDNGTESPSGGTREGRMISFVNECPVVVPTPSPTPEPSATPAATPTPSPTPQPTATPPTPTPAPTPPLQSETFVLPAGGNKVDILLVLDTTGSMDRELEKMSQRFSNLIDRLSGLDWQIAITNTGVGTGFRDGFAMNGRLMMPLEGPTSRSLIGYEVIKKTTPDAEKLFRLSIGREAFEGNCDYPPYCLGSKNQPLKAVIKTMERQLARGDTPFFRPGATYVPLIISDEDELENGPVTATQPQAVIDAFKTMLNGRSPKMVAQGLIVKPGDVTCLNSQSSFFNSGGKYGNLISDFITRTGGYVGSICENDYSFVLSSISENIRQSVDYVELQTAPAAGSVTVTFTPHVDATWTVSGKKIIFSRSIHGSTSIRVQYR